MPRYRFVGGCRFQVPAGTGGGPLDIEPEPARACHRAGTGVAGAAPPKATTCGMGQVD